LLNLAAKEEMFSSDLSSQSFISNQQIYRLWLEKYLENVSFKTNNPYQANSRKL